MFHTVGKNFAESGFWKTKLLDDYAVGDDPAAHPMLYTHFPTISGVLQGLLQLAGIKNIHYIKLSFIPLFLVGMIYYFLVIRKLFTEKIALIALAVTGTNYLGVLCWADSTVHSLHWLILFGGLLHYLSIPEEGALTRRDKLHVFMTFFYMFISGAVTYIHTLFLLITVGSFYFFKIHRVQLKHLVLVCSAPVLLFVMHQIRVISFLGWDVWLYDQIANIKKASNIIDYKTIVGFYAEHGIVIWPSDFEALTARQAWNIFYYGLKAKEGILGLYILFGLITVGVLSILVKKMRTVFGIEKFGVKVLILFVASVSWNTIFTTHATNYFNATPYILLAGMINLGWALLFSGISSQMILEKLFQYKKTYLLACIVLIVGFFYLRGAVFFKNFPQPIPGAGVLHQYHGAKCYSNIWPLFVSYYTAEWTVGGIHPQDAVERKPQNARLFLQRNKLYAEKYANPTYYFYAFSEKFAPFAAPKYKKILDEEFAVAECGKNWCIYKMEDNALHRGK